MNNLPEIKNKVKEVVKEVLQVSGATDVELTDTTPFFGSEEAPGVIQDSLAILEIASKLSEEYGILPSDFNEDAFQNVETLSEMIYNKLISEEIEVAVV